MIRLIATTLIALFALPTHADLGEGLRWMSRGQMSRAYEEFKESAEKGDVLSARALGGLLLRTTTVAGGQTFEARPEEAARWLRVAAEAGDKPAARMLGSLYAGGYGVARDADKSLEWFGRTGMDPGTYLEQAGKYATGPEQKEIAAWMAAVACNVGQQIIYPRAAYSRNLSGEVEIEVDAATRSARAIKSNAGDAITHAMELTYTRALEIAAPPETAVRNKVKTTVKLEFKLAN